MTETLSPTSSLPSSIVLIIKEESVMRMSLVLGMCFVLSLSAACTASPQAPAVPTTGATSAVAAVEPAAAVPAVGPTSAVPADWQTYTNPAGFSIKYPATWTQQEVPQETGQTFSTVTLQGTEGAVNLRWGVGFGGACPEGYTTVKVAVGELPTCYVKNADGTEAWTQINKELQTTSFSGDAKTSSADQASHDLILQVLSTLSFPATQ
jgi:hypothetical protein